MELDELYALLAFGAVSPYVVEATITWMERSGRSKSIKRFFRSPLSNISD